MAKHGQNRPNQLHDATLCNIPVALVERSNKTSSMIIKHLHEQCRVIVGTHLVFRPFWQAAGA